VDYLGTLRQISSIETSNMWEKANVFYSKSISKKDFMTYFAILLRIEENKKKYRKLRSTWIIQFSLEAFRSLPSGWTYYLQLEVSKFSRVSNTETSVSNFSASDAKKTKCSVYLSGNLKKKPRILFLLRIGDEADKTRRELVA